MGHAKVSQVKNFYKILKFNPDFTSKKSIENQQKEEKATQE